MTEEAYTEENEEEIDGCLCDDPIGEEDATPDVDLPAADGGVE